MAARRGRRRGERMTDQPQPPGSDEPEQPPRQPSPPRTREPSRIRLPRDGGALPEDIEQHEIVQGAKPGSKFARRVRAGERRFQKDEETGTIRATRVATAPRTAAQRAWARVRRVAIGAPISSEESEHQRLSKLKALPVFSSDALSSSAYATDEILLVLIAAGTSALVWSIPIALAIATLLAIVTFSYRQTIRAYPSGGGAYIVARENMGDVAGITAAAGLAVGYILTVAVSVAAGAVAVVSAFPELDGLQVPISVAAVAIVTLLNLRGIRESGTIFAIPTYGFIVAFGALIVAGFIRLLIDPSLEAPELGSAKHAGTASVTAFLVLRAFSSGSAALTGVEAISNGIPAFKKTEWRNAQITLTWMAVILACLFVGITILAHMLGVRHSEEVSAPAQIAKTVYGDNVFFYVTQAFTAGILFLAANTVYADFPRLGSILARDRFLPHQFLFRGDRLAFSNGIIVLGLAASALLVLFNANLNRLIAMYAFGVFMSFTLSQSGMVLHWLRVKEPGWKRSAVINSIGGGTTGLVAVIVGSTKFMDGAWLAMIGIGVLALVLWWIYSHNTSVEEELTVPAGQILQQAKRHPQAVLVPVDKINRAVLRNVDYALTISPNVRAIHVTDDLDEGAALRRQWEQIVLDVELVMIESPYRSFVAPVVSYIDALNKQYPGQFVTVVLPEFRTFWPWHRFLHNQSAARLKKALLGRDDTVIVEVPYQLGTGAGATERAIEQT